MFTCYGDFWLMKATANTTYLLKMTNMGSGRVETETVTSNSEGFVVLTTDWSNYLVRDTLYLTDRDGLDHNEMGRRCCHIPARDGRKVVLP